VGGLIVVPWQSPFGRQAVARLRVVEPGVAMGNFTSLCGFMLNRAQEVQPSNTEVFTPRDHTDGRSGRTQLDGSKLFTYSQRAWALSYRIGDPGVYRVPEGSGSGLWLHDGQTDSWSFTDAQGNVWQGGPRSIWTELEEAVAWYETSGEPGVTRFGMTVTKDREAVWLDHSGNVLLAQGKESSK
jgi:protein-L-isoaspartate(D-aspartate) O-methyltransferase